MDYNYNLKDLSAEIFTTTYQYNGESVDEMFKRIAKNLSLVESDQEYYTQRFYDVLRDFRFIPGGRIISNAGTEYKSTSYINCFVSGFRGNDIDSMESISSELARQALILKSEGGYGFCCSALRPRGTLIKGIGSSSPGMVEFLQMWDTQSGVITKGSGISLDTGKKKIRKGAQMVTAYVWHPDIEEFITAKQIPNNLTKFNMSVLLTDKFMKAVISDSNWDLIFPDIEENKLFYKEYWTGDIEKWLKIGGKVKIYKTLKAVDLYNLIMESTYNRAEPGCIFIDTVNEMNNLTEVETINATNPCQPKWATILTPDGIKTLEEVGVGDYIWSKDGWTKIVNKWSTGIKDVYEYRTTRNVFYGTENHKIVQNGNKIEVKEAKEIDSLQLTNLPEIQEFNINDIMDGLVIGDGSVHKASNNLVFLCIGENDKDYFNSNIKDLIIEHRPGLKNTAYTVKTTIDYQELPLTFNRSIPNRFLYGDFNKVRSFLRGLYSANGSVVDKRITLKTSSPKIRDQVQLMLSSIGINSYFTINKKKNVEFENGIYEVKESYDINISTDRLKFYNLIGFIQEYKNDKLKEIIKTKNANRKEKNLIKFTTYISTEEVFDITVDNESHTYWTGGCNVSNCGEQPLPVGGACLLGSINVTQYILPDRSDFNYDALANDIPYIVRMLDNVIDLTYMPLDEQYNEIQNKRRIGIGVTGLGSALMIMNLKYGSKESLEIVERYFKTVTNLIYKASSYLATVKGAFPLYNYENFTKGGFHKILDKDTLDYIKENGLRNSHLTSIQPTGNTSILANNVSGGLEPVFMTEYIRSHGVDVLPKGLPKHTEWTDTYFEGDVEFKTYNFNGIKYKWNKSAGYTKESLVEDYAVSYLKSLGLWDSAADWAATTTSLSVKNHIDMMQTIAPYIDAAMSKTINVPNDYPFEDFKKLYIDGWKTKYIKGLTTYRAGTMSAVLKSKEETSQSSGERPVELLCQVVHFKNERKEWVAFIGIHNNMPYEIFTGPKDLDVFPIPTSVTEGTIIKVRQENDSRYDFRYVDSYGYTNTLGGLSRIFDKEYWNYGRLVSGLLRSKIPVAEVIKIVDGLNFTKVGLNNWKSGVIRALKPFIVDGTPANGATCENCGSSNIVYQEGCLTCADCGSSRCG